jgi:hypothetical protein
MVAKIGTSSTSFGIGPRDSSNVEKISNDKDDEDCELSRNQRQYLLSARGEHPLTRSMVPRMQSAHDALPHPDHPSFIRTSNLVSGCLMSQGVAGFDDGNRGSYIPPERTGGPFSVHASHGSLPATLPLKQDHSRFDKH